MLVTQTSTGTKTLKGTGKDSGLVAQATALGRMANEAHSRSVHLYREGGESLDGCEQAFVTRRRFASCAGRASDEPSQPYYQDDLCTIYHARCEGVCRGCGLELTLLLADPLYGDAHDRDYTRFTGGVAVSTGSHAPIEVDRLWFYPAPFWSALSVVLFGANPL